MPRKSPLISIVTPSFNQGEFIEENIRSILLQCYGNFEHIIIDGCSTDSTVNILKKYEHLKWVSEKDSGQSNALNKGFRKAKGEIIGWLNSDDYYEKDVFKKIIAAFESDKSLKIVFGDSYIVSSDSRKRKFSRSNFVSFKDWIHFWKKKSNIYQPSVFFRRELFDEFGYLDESLHYAMDFELFCRFFKKYTPKYLPLTVSNNRFHEKCKTVMESGRFNSRFWKESKKVSEKYWGASDAASFYFYRFFFLIKFLLAKARNSILNRKEYF